MDVDCISRVKGVLDNCRDGLRNERLAQTVNELSGTKVGENINNEVKELLSRI
jgi:hypothetical protein